MATKTTQNGNPIVDSKNTNDSKPPLNDSGCESLTLSPKLIDGSQTESEIENKTDQDETDIDDLILLRKDPKTNRAAINKKAYLKLHRATSPTGKSANILKEKYESNSDIETYLRSRNSFGSPDPAARYSLAPRIRNSQRYNSNPKIPVPRPRNLIHSDSSSVVRIRPHSETSRSRLTFPFHGVLSKKDENANDVLRKNSSSSGEFITIVTRSDSEGSIDKLKSELDLFTMEEKAKDKKRNNSFRRIFSGKIFSKEKKKKEEPEPQTRVPCKENVVYSDNMKNENNAFNRNSAYRHTVGSGSNMQKDIKLYRNDSQRSMQKPNYDPKQLEQRYAQMHINEFNQIKRNFENARPPNEQYVRMDKPLITNNPGPVNYTKMGNLSRYIDSSSSVSTLESEREAHYQNEVLSNAHKKYMQQQQQQQNLKQQQTGSLPSNKSVRYVEPNKEYSRDTPPRAQEVRQDVRLVNPKALIPINSERPLPNPYHHTENHSAAPTFRSNSHHSLRIIHQQPDQNINNSAKGPHLDETYSIVFDSVDNPQKRTNDGLQRTASLRANMKPLEPLRPPRSPSLESSKLKLPTNRDIGPLSPRMKSPIPQDKVSTEKIIATELLKPRTPTPTRKPTAKPLSPSHQKLEIAIDYPDNIKDDRSDNNSIISEAVSDKPSLTRSAKSPETTLQNQENPTRQLISPVCSAPDQYRASPISHRSQSQSSVYRISAASPIPELQDKVITNAMVHVNSMNLRSPSQTNLNHLRSLSPGDRSVTPVDLRTPTSTSSQSPQKDEMRRNVEAYYWKELKRLKEQENMDMYYYQMQMMRTPSGYAEDPITTRRARSMSPTSQRNGRRSLSLPRDPKPSNHPNQPQMNQYGRFHPNAIPENRMVANQAQLIFDYNNQMFRRNAPERRTVDALPRNFDPNSLYRPIFKRGSLSTPARDSSDDGQNKRVSFSSSRTDVQNAQNPQSWPTKNGYTQSPPQRRNTMQDDDEVFLPNNPQTKRLIVDGKEMYGYTNKPPTYAEYQQRQTAMQYQSKQNILAQQRPIYDTNPNATYGSTKPPPPRESPYGPLVVANVRPQKQPNNAQKAPYGPLVVTNNRPSVQMNPQDDGLYGQPIDAIPRVQNNLTRNGSMQLRENVYAQKPPLPRKMSYDAPQGSLMIRYDTQRAPRREIIMTDEIFGQFGGYVHPNGNMRYPPQQQNLPTNVARQNLGEPQPQYVQNGTRQIAESPYGYARAAPRQVSVRNKVCDIYGQIHDSDSNQNMTPAHQRTGVVMGQLQNSNQNVRQQSYGQLPNNENFVRNSRLTASANDMYRRYQNVDPRIKNEVYQNQQWQNPEDGPPNRPLPPVPADRRQQIPEKSKTESTEKVKKSKKRGFFGK